ncbi:MAG: MFS transporter [Candidatus Omnitrophica bacterium]|nr:MFS transporter [Candidatus Omnitrophota bacterium]
MKNRKLNASFKSLLGAQFLGAFNDNAFKIIISLLGIQLISATSQSAAFVSIIGALFVIPFIVFSPLAGYLADRYRKRNVIVIMKIGELLIMTLGLWGLMTKNLIFLCVILFLMAAQSAFFSPAKYGILPEILSESQISRGNGYLQMFTFTAIILGSAFGGKIKEVFDPNIWMVSIILIGLSIIGLGFSLRMDKGAAARPNARFKLNGFKRSLEIIKIIHQNKPLFLALCAISYFWFLGAVFQMNILLYAKQVLSAGDSNTGILLAIVALGIGIGSILAGRLSEGQIEFGLVPLGAIGLTIFCSILGISGLTYFQVSIVLFLLGVSAGFYTVPLNAYFQTNCPKEERGEFLGAMNIITAFATLSGSLFIWLVGVKFAATPGQTFLTLGALSVMATIYILKTLPSAFVRLVNWIVTHTLYCLNIEGIENVPEQGGALLICNHVSYIDAMIALAALKRPVRFIMYRKIYNLPFLHQFCKIMRVIPIDYQDGPKAIVRSLQQARTAIEKGEIVCIFPEGGLTRTGNLQPFNRGFEKIMQGLSAPIIPMYLDNIWGSIFSFHDGRYFWKLPRRTPYPLTVVFGLAMPAESRDYQVRIAVQELGAAACKLRGVYRKKLHISFIDIVKKQPFKFCMADSTGLKLTYLKTLAAVLLLKHKLFPKKRRPMETNEMIGVLLPASCMGSIVNGAVLFAGKVPVNLNFTLSSESFDSCLKQCRMESIITSRKFLEKINIPETKQMIFLEDIKQSSGFFDKLRALCLSLMPGFLIRFFCVDGDKQNVDDPATVIFSSGSTGEPKGIILSHGNIFSNIEGFYQVFNVQPNDVVIGALPFFHSFGFTATLCFPVGAGIGVVYHSNPMDAGIIGSLTEKYKATIIMGTPTFLSAYLRKCGKQQFKTLRFAVAGAEKLKQQLADAFKEKFGIIPLEGYGATELSPIVSIGYPDYVSRDKRIVQIGNKSGTVGHPLPGIAAKVVDPDTFEILPYDCEGLLLIKGPNVMKGYLNNPQKTEQVIKDGWYITGDIAMIDSDGFIKITDRLTRFSKIGGEMVPHIKIEESILEIIGTVDQVCVVTSVGDDKKGERLTVLHTIDINVDHVLRSLTEAGLPNLWTPKKNSFYRVEKIPVLGTGKLDLKGIKTIARELSEKPG